jgi:hypothetical protein
VFKKNNIQELTVTSYKILPEYSVIIEFCEVFVIVIIIISGITARIGPWPPLTGFRDG